MDYSTDRADGPHNRGVRYLALGPAGWPGESSNPGAHRPAAAGNLGNCAPVGEGVSEMKIDVGPGYRVYFVQRGLELIILLAGGDKSTQAKDIALAKELAGQL
jgi:putative addiction module killer protein